MLQQWIIYLTQFTDLFKNKPHQLNSQPTVSSYALAHPKSSRHWAEGPICKIVRRCYQALSRGGYCLFIVTPN